MNIPLGTHTVRFHIMDMRLTESSDDLSEGGVNLVPLQQTCNKYRAHIVLNMLTLLIIFLFLQNITLKM
jgi:hypothetical protein